MRDATVSDRKAVVRQRLLTARRGLDAAVRVHAAATIRRHLVDLDELSGRQRLLAYAATPVEVDVDPLVRAWLDEGRAVHLPFVDGDDLGLARITDLDRDLTPGWGNVREPRRPGRRPVDPTTMDAAVVPGVGFDRHGGRLGYGGGHFDRLLARLRPEVPKVGVAFAAQVVDRLPTSDHDVAVDVVVTEDAVHRR